MLRPSDPPVTWLLPVRNSMPFLVETLDSLASQTYGTSEVLAWDNGSTDGTVEELRRWIPSRIPGRVITDRPMPLGHALAEMVRSSTTELCARIDGDDIAFPRRLEQQVAFLASHPEVAVVGSHFIEIDAAGNKGVLTRMPLDDAGIVRHLLCGPGIAHPSALFRRSAVLGAGNYQHGGAAQDYDLWLRMAVQYRMANLDEPLLYYRVHDESTTARSNRAGTRRMVTLERFVQHGPELFGMSQEEARVLANGGHWTATLTLTRIANHLAARSNTNTMEVLRSPVFIHAARCLLGSPDPITGTVLAILGWAPRPPRVLRRLWRVLKRAAGGQGPMASSRLG